MKNQAIFSSIDKIKKLKCRLLQFLFGTLRVKYSTQSFEQSEQSHYFSLFRFLRNHRLQMPKGGIL